jgi:hypothetical protein
VFFGLDIVVLPTWCSARPSCPEPLGVLLVIDGLAYLCYSFTDILAPGVAARLVPWIQLPHPHR